MKRIIRVIVFVAVLCTICACGNTKEKQTEKSASIDDVKDRETTSVVQRNENLQTYYIKGKVYSIENNAENVQTTMVVKGEATENGGHKYYTFYTYDHGKTIESANESDSEKTGIGTTILIEYQGEITQNTDEGWVKHEGDEWYSISGVVCMTYQSINEIETTSIVQRNENLKSFYVEGEIYNISNNNINQTTMVVKGEATENGGYKYYTFYTYDYGKIIESVYESGREETGIGTTILIEYQGKITENTDEHWVRQEGDEWYSISGVVCKTYK